jgi:hypothetical protein
MTKIEFHPSPYRQFLNKHEGKQAHSDSIPHSSGFFHRMMPR